MTHSDPTTLPLQLIDISFVNLVRNCEFLFLIQNPAFIQSSRSIAPIPRTYIHLQKASN